MSFDEEKADYADALHRLGVRCKAAKDDPLLQQVLANNDGDRQTLLRALQALLVRPGLTLATATICRPVVLSIVASLVDEAVSNGGGGGGQPAVCVAVALVNTFAVAQHVEREVIRYFTHCPSPCHYLSDAGGGSGDLPEGITPADIARSTLFGLQRSTDLRRLWQWPALLPLLSSEDPDVRWCGVHCMGIALGGGDTLTSDILQRIMEPSVATECAVRWQSTCAALAAEEAAMFCDVEPSTTPGSQGASQIAKSASPGRKRKAVDMPPLHHGWPVPSPPGYTDVCGLDLPQRGEVASFSSSAGSQVTTTHDLVLTQSMQRNVRAFALGLCVGSPILLEGPPSSGKSALITHLAAATGNATDMVRVHLDDQTDSKTLMGAYICTSKPGEFVWQPGPLTQAVTRGCWVVIEDINLASAEVLATLLPLVERRTLHVPSRGEELTAARGFQLIATVTSDPGAIGAGAYGSSQTVKDLLGGLFHSVRMEPAPLIEQTEVVAQLFPALVPLVPHAIASVALVQVALRQRAAAELQAGDGQALAERVGQAMAAAGLRVGECNLGRYFSFRDLLKWARRMATVHAPLLGRSLRGSAADYQAEVTTVPIAVREAAFTEAADVLCGAVGRHELADKLLAALAVLWAVPSSVAEHYSLLAKPAANLGETEATIGRATLAVQRLSQSQVPAKGHSRFAQTGHSMRLMERVAVSIANAEPVLLVGETGTGKTTLVQEVAAQVKAKLVVINLSQQTDSSDLVGGFRPLQPADAVAALLQTFVDLIRRTWLRGNNDDFLDRVLKMARKRRWQQLLKAYRTAAAKVGLEDAAVGKEASKAAAGREAKKQRRSAEVLDAPLREEWMAFVSKVDAAETSALAAEGGFAFGFFEGALVQAVREGWWLLLDEINLAPAEALERIASLLEDDGSSITVAERGDIDAVVKHPHFRLFAAMNPATDAGKKELPAPLRNRFTEMWVGEPRQREDLAAIVAGHLIPVSVAAPVGAVVDFYLAAKEAADSTLQDGAGHKPAYNLRTLSRALEYSATTSPVYGMQRALYDGFAMSFLTQLDPNSTSILEKLLVQHLIGKGSSLKAIMGTKPSPPSNSCVLFDHYWVETGDVPVAETREADGKGGVFVTTPAVTQHLRNLARAVLLRKYPILLQGPTSSGKTSLVAYLAAQTGHHFVRINNHEQTDLQEYLGSYISDEQGRLVFQEGLLVQAVRKGHWIVLDELNLAPTEVLEALNRLLDDNRELFVPELQEVVKPHPHFMLFATQNPPGLYAGRKTLSRAFRSRFLELHVEDIPDDELHIILEKRCAIAPSYAKKLVEVMRELQRRRALSNVFAGRHGFITPRDLFRWADRGAIGYQQLAEAGFAVLGERLRSSEERATVLQALEKLMKTKIDMQTLYDSLDQKELQLDDPSLLQDVGRLVWTQGFRRMYWLLERCLEHSEPALLVGETGIGKTTVVQLAAFTRKQALRIINCNQHTETADFLGGYRPNRNREKAMSGFLAALETFNGIAQDSSLAIVASPTGMQASSLLQAVDEAVQVCSGAPTEVCEQLRKLAQEMSTQAARFRAPFEWVDGPLVTAMKQGEILLIDELNLAEDAVLERLNSVLEPSRSLTLAEKGGKDAQVIVAHPNFRVIATMNPGGDYGKKELSPALSNRFTSIWVPSIDDESELTAILNSRLDDDLDLQALPSKLLAFWSFYEKDIAPAARQILSVRDLLTWIQFINATAVDVGALMAYVHGAHVAFVDGIGLGVGLSEEAAGALRSKCHRFLVSQLSPKEHEEYVSSDKLHRSVTGTETEWGMAPFFVERLEGQSHQGAQFDFNAPTTAKNTFRVLRAMKLRKPILLEGSPGVGKTSLIAAIAKAAGRKFVRINLSEQTDMMDLLGADLPVEGGGAGEFAWADGPLLQAIKSGAWVLMDELNLANQTVLEGLNALLDHRAEVFIPELNATFKCTPGFRIFGAQNPLQEGGGRKGLPKSFLNRFSRVHVELLQRDDLLFIAGMLHSAIPHETICRMVDCLDVLHRDARGQSTFGGTGGPWEFNLRDLLRWCELITSHVQSLPTDESLDPDFGQIARHYADMLLAARMRTPEDRAHVLATVSGFLADTEVEGSSRSLSMTPSSLQIGWANLERQGDVGCQSAVEDHSMLNCWTPVLESLAECISRQWMCLVVGPTGTGKTTIVRTLAQLCGRPLLELPLNNGTDTSDLLGGFEQVDLLRKRHQLLSAMQTLLAKIVAVEMRLACPSERISGLQSLTLSWGVANRQESPASLAHEAKTCLEALTELVQPYQQGPELQAISDLMHRVREQAEAILTAGDTVDGRFEWVDGSLTRAIMEGRWVVLDNANLCNPSVLDRLNPLLEPHGLLYLNECGSGVNGPRVITPHPDFRLFLTFDPKHGEVSRAMRNRGIELFMLPDRSSGLVVEGWKASGGSSRMDMDSLLSLERLPGHVLPDAIIATHSDIRARALKRHRRPPSARELRRWASMLRELCSRGQTTMASLRTAFEHIYVQPIDDSEGRIAAELAFQDIFCGHRSLPCDEPGGWFRPAVWPLPATAGAFAADSQVAAVSRDCSVVLYWAGRLALPADGSFQVEEAAAALSDATFLASHGIGATMSVPGGVLGSLLLGVQPGYWEEPASGDDSRASASLPMALRVFMERGAHSPEYYLAWASAFLGQATAIQANVPGLVDAVEALRAYLTHPLLSAGLGAQAVATAAQLMHLKEAVGAAVILKRVMRAEDGVEAAGESILQLSFWRYNNPRARSKVPAPHPAVDWLWPFFTAAQGCEEWLLNPEQAEIWTGSLAEKLEAFQAERWALLHAVQLDETVSNPSSFSSSGEVIFFRWMRLRSAVASLAEELAGSGGGGGEHTAQLQQISAQLDTTLGLNAGLPPTPRLWKSGGKPVLPPSQEHVEAAGQLMALCNTLRASTDSSPAGVHADIAAAVEHASINSMEEGDDTYDAIQAREDARAATAAMLAADISLRRSILEGTCLFEAGAHLHGTGGKKDINSVYSGVVDAFQERAYKAAALAVAAASGPGGAEDASQDISSALSGEGLLALPTNSLARASARTMQMELAAWADVSCSKAQLYALAGPDSAAILSLLCTQEDVSAISSSSILSFQLETVVQAVISSGCRDVYEGVPYHQLRWLMDAFADGTAVGDAASPEWRLEMLRSLAHEATFRWHRGLWRGAASKLPKFGRGTINDTLWQAQDGPMRLHLSTLTVHAAPLTTSAGVHLEDRALRVLQLQTAGRHLRSACSAKDDGTLGDVEATEWRAAVLVAASILSTHVADMQQSDQSSVLDVVSHISAASDPAFVDSGVLAVLASAVAHCGHSRLRELAPALLLPALETLFTKEAASSGTQGLALRGRAWVLLGLARLHLCVPPAGTDPAAVYSLLRQHTLDILEWRVRPELAVRRQYACLPGGPAEQGAILALASQEVTMEEGAAELEGKSPPRPSPPQYLSLREDVARFAEGLAAVPRVLRLAEAVAAGGDAALAEADVWQENAAAAVERMPMHYPLYRDILQPVQLAVYEVRYGLRLATGAAHLAARSRGDASLLQATAARLMAFPLLPSMSEPLEAAGVQRLVAGMASDALEPRAETTPEDVRNAKQAAGLMARLNLLRVSLQRAREDWRQAPTVSARKDAAARLDEVFAAVIVVWEDMKEEEARRAAEEAELFKTKVRSTTVQTEEEEAEVEFKEQFPDQFGAFADLVDEDDMPLEGEGGGALVAPEPAAPAASGSAGAGAAAFSARTFILGTVLEDVIQAHAEVFAASGASSNADVVGSESGFEQPGAAAFLRSYDLGMRLVQQAGGLLPSQLDDETLTGHLYALSARAKDLKVGAGPAGGVADASSGDIHAPRPEEAVLAQEPLVAVRTRVAELLEQWPDHPVLAQLDAIAARILSMPATAPLKGLLTGLELLLARAQVWEETAAKHVTITPQLKAVAALGTRWRRLELDGWRALLERTVVRAVQGAHMGWFHLHRILVSGDSPVTDVAAAVEDFVQASPLGEFAARLQLLRAFRWQLAQQATQAGDDTTAAERWRRLAAILYNVQKYYSQFLPAVQAAIDAGMAPLEKDLRDFVKLAKWEDRGFYAMKASTERAQRHLHKLCRRAADLLKQPVAGPLALAAKSMGLGDLQAPESVGMTAVPAAAKGAIKAPILTGADVAEVLTDVATAAAALDAVASEQIPIAASTMLIPAAGGKFTQRLPDLTRRFVGVVSGALASKDNSLLNPALSTDDLASQAASNALHLRQDITKGAKSRKKKAFVDFLKMLGEAGVSKLRADVPANARGAQARFSQAVPDVDALLRGGNNATPSVEQRQAAEAAWAKADAYHFASIARLQRLLEAAKHPNPDIVPAEVGIACRLSEHLVYLTHLGRESLGGVASHFVTLDRLVSVLGSDDWNADLPLQTCVIDHCQRRQESLAGLTSVTTQTQQLLRSAAELEPVAALRQPLEQAAEALSSVLQQLEGAAAGLTSLTRASFPLRSGGVLVTLALQTAVVKADTLVTELAEELSQAPHGTQPGWKALAAAFTQACSQSAASAPSPKVESSSSLLEEVAAHVEAVVEAGLIWAQNVAEGIKDDDLPEGEEETESDLLPVVMQKASKRLGISRLAHLLEHAAAAMNSLAALADTGDAAATRDGAALLSSLTGMLRTLRAAAWQLAARSLALHRSVCKLTYVTSALLTGVVEEGYCIPEEGEEGEPQEGDEKITEGTGLGEGDTRGAKDISDELEDEDQLLGAQQKDQENKPEQSEAPEPEGPEGPKGVEMEEDFDGALEDVQPNDAEEDEEGPEDEEDAERLDQQMGDVGDAAEDVDEKLWGDDEKEEDQKEEAGHDEDNKVKVDDASKLDYAQGQDKEDEDAGGQQDKPPVDAPQQAEGGEEPPPEDEEQEQGEGQGEEEDLGEYEDRPEDRGFVRPEAPDEEMQLPDDLNLDGGEKEEEGEEEDDLGGENEKEEPIVKDQGGEFPEQGDAMEEEKEGQENDGQKGEDGEQPEPEPDNGTGEGGRVDEMAQPEGEEDAGGEEGEEEDKDEDMPMVNAEDEEQQAAQEAAQADGEKGQAAAAVAAGIDGGAKEEKDQAEDKRFDAGASAQAAAEPPQAAGGSAAGGADGLQDDAAAAQMSSRGLEAPKPEKKKQGAPPQADANPFRNLGTALERWKANLAMAGDAQENEDGPADADAAMEQDNVDGGNGGGEDEGPPPDGEFRFLGQDEAQQAGDTQTLAGATHEQAGMQAGEEDGGPDIHAQADNEDAAGGEEGDAEDDAMAVEEEDRDGGAPPPPLSAQPLAGNATWGAGDKAGVQQPDAGGPDDMDTDQADGEGGVGAEGEEEGGEGDDEENADGALVDGIVASKLQATHLYDEGDAAGPSDALSAPLTGERAEALREELERRLRAASEGGVGAGDAEYGAEVWSRCEALTSGLVGELAEQLRLILEPTLASKLGGEYRTGKRINMKKVIGYIASHFRKDKIWMRRTRPDKRQYQVLVAVDDSRSMAETGCGTFALEALTLICKAMSRLDVGELGVVSFGGTGGAEPLHPLDRPFTDADGVRVMSHMKFDQDNTIGDSPMVDVITSMDHLLDGAAARAAASPAGPAALHQLVLIIADGRFHEKEALKRAARDAASRPGVLYAFIILDNAANSILDMQSVAFAGGKPVFTKYIDTFPFPFYIVLRDTTALPRTLADLLRQWFELSSG